LKRLMSVTIAMVLLSILSGCLGGAGEPESQPSAQPSAQTQTLIDETKTINADKTGFYGFEIYKGAEIEIELKVLSGGAIDVFLVDSSNNAKYNYILGGGTGEFEYIIGGSSIGTKAFKRKFTVPPGTYYFVVDNTEIPVGGAAPTGSVDVKIKVLAKSPVEEGQIGQVATRRAAGKRSVSETTIQTPKQTPEEETQTLIDETKTINADSSGFYGFEVYKGAEIEIELKVLSGGAIDVFLVDSSDYARYNYILGGGTGKFGYIVDGSSVSTKAFKRTFTVPRGTYYFVVDNTAMTVGGAAPTGSVDVKIEVIAKSL